ncbi:MAG: hypothetical protein RL160_435 [Bacteroidota bacterium]|jgi:hypothetical protein
MLHIDYNTSRPQLKNSEFGRAIQDYVHHIMEQTDKAKRTSLCHSLVQVMLTLNPSMREQADARQKLWDHLYLLSDFKLDVDGPFPAPTEASVRNKPQHIPYNDSMIRFRFYGRNLQLMVQRASEMEDGPIKQDLVNLIASFMYNSCKSWNNENLSNEVIAEHLRILSKGQLELNPERLEVYQDHSIANKKFQRPQREFRQGGGRNQGSGGGKFNRRNRNFRKF